MSDLLQQGRKAEATGNLAAAEAAYRGVLQAQPEHQEALRRLGALLPGDEGARFESRARRLEADALAASALQLLRQGKLRLSASSTKRALEIDPSNLDVLRVSALLSAAVGEYESAQAAYYRILDLSPGDSEAELALKVMRGEVIGAQTDMTATPVAPHCRLRGFLAPEEREWLLGFALSNLDALGESTVVREKPWQVDRAARSSQVLTVPGDIRGWFVPKLRVEVEKAMPRIGLSSFTPGQIELQITLHRDGDFFKIHADSTGAEVHDSDRVATTRKVSFVYYFSRLPQRFCGGELKLYRAVAGGRGFDPAAAFLLPPEDNSIVFFPSSLFHEVRPVRLESEDPGDGRFTLNGWIHESPS